jgi:hypothetical protein
MTARLRRLSVLPAVALAAIGLAACGSGGSSSTTTGHTATTANTSTVIGHSTTLAMNPAFALSMKNAGITVTTVAPAQSTKGALFTFPETGGTLVLASFSGTIDHSGTLEFSHNGKTVKLSDFVLDTNSKQITAKLGDGTVALFDLNLASVKRVTVAGGAVLSSNIKLDLTAQAATELNSILVVTTFTHGMTFGLATLNTAVK